MSFNYFFLVIKNLSGPTFLLSQITSFLEDRKITNLRAGLFNFKTFWVVIIDFSISILSKFAQLQLIPFILSI